MSLEDPGSVSFAGIGGLGEQVRELREVIELPLLNPELFEVSLVVALKSIKRRALTKYSESASSHQRVSCCTVPPVQVCTQLIWHLFILDDVTDVACRQNASRACSRGYSQHQFPQSCLFSRKLPFFFVRARRFAPLTHRRLSTSTLVNRLD